MNFRPHQLPQCCTPVGLRPNSASTQCHFCSLYEQSCGWCAVSLFFRSFASDNSCQYDVLTSVRCSCCLTPFRFVAVDRDVHIVCSFDIIFISSLTFNWAMCMSRTLSLWPNKSKRNKFRTYTENPWSTLEYENSHRNVSILTGILEITMKT